MIVSAEQRDSQEDVADALLAMTRAVYKAGGRVTNGSEADLVIEAAITYTQGDPLEQKKPTPHMIRVAARRTADNTRYSFTGPGLGDSSASGLGRWALEELRERIRAGD